MMCVTCKSDEVKVGDYVHRKNITMGVRVGGAAVHVLKYLSKTSAVVEITNQSGTFLTEELMTYPEFVERYEKCQ